MAENIRKFLTCFGQGMLSFARGSDRRMFACRHVRKSVDYYFARVGQRLVRGRLKFENEYLGAMNAGQ